MYFKKFMKTNIYIDANNLHVGAKVLGYKINYKKFIGWLKQKYQPNNVYLFIGFISLHRKLYCELETYGYGLVFRETTKSARKIKGNCDSELVLQICIDLYENNVNYFILISGDGDFSCILNFLIKKNHKTLVILPNIKRSSRLLKRNDNIFKLENHYHKFRK